MREDGAMQHSWPRGPPSDYAQPAAAIAPEALETDKPAGQAG